MKIGVAMLIVGLFAALPALAGEGGKAPVDPYLWLEDVTGAKPLEWVAAQNHRTTDELAQSDEFKAMNVRFLDILNSTARIPYVEKIGGLYYNFWRDKDHEKGLWRRTTLEQYRKDSPRWETVLDLDALSHAENVSWVFHGASALPPEDSRCLISLSRGGADAAVVREFDLGTKAFVPDGFAIPESKSGVSWIDRDRVFVEFAFDSSTMTTSGYPRIIKEWKRGTPLASATPVFEGKSEDVSVRAFRDLTPGFERDFVVRAPSFFTNELYVRRGERMVKLDKPDDAEASPWREWLLVQLRSDWTVGGRTWPAGTLMAANFEDFLAGKREFQMLFEPSERRSLAGFSPLRHAIVLNELDEVRSRLYLAREQGGRWTREPISGLPEIGNLDAGALDAYESDDFWVRVSDYLTPDRLMLAHAGATSEPLKQSPSFFDAGTSVVSQHWAISKDGTRVPYFQVAPKNLKLDGSTSTLLYGYGGFEVSETPDYGGPNGAGWIEKGGVFVDANIRGGGEFGPNWHRSALKANRPRAYEDFIAVAEDLVKRRVTSPRHLACWGGSNGGLLVGNMLTRRPDLFGAMVCRAPLLDMRRYSHLLAGASWMEEYGNPDIPSEWAFIEGFSPYQNVRRGTTYPRTLFTSSTRDDRVHPAHARKMVARMEEQGHDVLYYENVEGGHGGSANNTQEAFMLSLAYTFLWKQLR